MGSMLSVAVVVKISDIQARPAVRRELELAGVNVIVRSPIVLDALRLSPRRPAPGYCFASRSTPSKAGESRVDLRVRISSKGACVLYRVVSGLSGHRNNLDPVPRFILSGAPEYQRLGESQALWGYFWGYFGNPHWLPTLAINTLAKKFAFSSL